MSKKLYLVLERTPLFFLEDEMVNLTDPELEVSDEFYESYQEIENNFRVIQEALFHMYLESQLETQQEITGIPEEEDEFMLQPVHDLNKLH